MKTPEQGIGRLRFLGQFCRQLCDVPDGSPESELHPDALPEIFAEGMKKHECLRAPVCHSLPWRQKPTPRITMHLKQNSGSALGANSPVRIPLGLPSAPTTCVRILGAPEKRGASKLTTDVYARNWSGHRRAYASGRACWKTGAILPAICGADPEIFSAELQLHREQSQIVFVPRAGTRFGADARSRIAGRAWCLRPFDHRREKV